MEQLYQHHQKLMMELKTSFYREAVDTIAWNERLIAIKGARGVGKTTLILQYIKENFKMNPAALYISMDQIQIAGKTILEIAESHYNNGGTHLFVDEVHKYENWSIELKNIYDSFANLHVVFTSSSILQIYKGYADLSRRVLAYSLNGLSFREYIQIETKESFAKYKLQEVLKNHVTIAADIATKIKPLAYWNDYLQYGYFPFYLQGKKSYYQKLNNVLNTIIEVDMPFILGVSVQNVGKLKQLVKIIASSLPFEPNITKLSEVLGVTRNTITQYLYYLEQAEIINLLSAANKSYSQLAKPEKIYLQNANTCYALGEENVEKGTMRELFFMNQLKPVCTINSSLQGEFLVNEKYIFEVGDAKKSYKQIADIKNSFIAADLEIGIGNKIPLWLFGFLY